MDVRLLLEQLKQQFSTQSLIQAIQHNKEKFINQHHKRPSHPSIKYSLFQTGYGPTEYKTYPQESSDSESPIHTLQEYTTVHAVANTILCTSIYTTIPCSTIIRTSPPKSMLLIQKIERHVNMQEMKEFIDILPIKGFVVNMRPVYFQSKPCVLIELKTDQSLIVVNQLHSKQHSKQAKQLLGSDFKCVQLVELGEEKSNFSGIILRGLENSWSAPQVEKIICYELKLKTQECITESCKDIVTVENTRCMVVGMKDLEICEQVVLAFNGTNLSGLQKQKLYVNIHPMSTKKRRSYEDSMHRGLFKISKMNSDKSTS